ncbi:xylanase inhibitor protein 2 [Oryza brachyantha]|uniref:xylanase inhibitor protein 2 n=1 Tax=Oryza brachyantha TaxID=4533 RepID=UPI001ADB6691|nr:xylanase inhibitor protein 2 [Oryza brachyantha]
MGLVMQALLLPLAWLLLLAAPAPATADDPGLAVYWGRHKEEGSLREACDTGRYTTVIITFYNVFGYHRGSYGLDISGHPVAAVGADIKHCQSKGVTVLLSIGGQGGDYSLPTNQSATDVADNLWNAYLGGHRAGVPRPFGGDAAVDGIDFFIDQGGADHYEDLARILNGYNKQYRGRVGVLLTATARCAYPDRRLEKALATGLFARIHVRMFGDAQCTMSPRYSWEKWAAAYPGSKVYIGLVASPEQDSAWMFQKDLYYEMLQFVRKLPNYGGMAIYDRYYDKKANYTGEG